MIEKKKYNFWTILMMGVSATIGLSILVTFGSVAQQTKNQPLLMVLTWIIGAILVVPDALIMSETAISFPGNGTTYYWLKKAKWKACSFWFGWILIFIFSATAIATATFALSGVINRLFDIKYGQLIAIGILLILVVSQIFAKNFAAKSQIFFTALKALPIAFIFIIAIIYGKGDSFKNGAFTKKLSQFYISSICLIPAIAMTLFAYTGMEAITYVSGEIENPRKTIPKAIIIGTIIVVTIYITLALAILAINTSDEWKSKNNNDNYKNVFYWAMANGNIPQAVSKTFLVLSLFIFVGSLNAFLLYQSRVVSKMSEEGDLFRFFQKRYKTTNTPYYAIILLVILALFYLFVGDLETVVSSFTLGIIFLKLIMLAVVIYLRLTNKDYQKIYSNKLFWILILISICGAIITFVGTIIVNYRGDRTKLWICLMVLAMMLGGYPFYYVKRWIAKKLQQQKIAKKLEIT